MGSVNSSKWLDAMKEELKSMDHNGVWDLIEGVKRVGCKQVFKKKHYSNDNIEWHKVRLVANVSLKRMMLTIM